MNISRSEQRVLHVLALGGRILHERGDGCQTGAKTTAKITGKITGKITAKITEVTCVTREGMILTDCTLEVFQRLRAKRLIESRSGSPYRISRRGRLTVRAQLDNQGG